jgi:D-alanine-D-alanine ligase
MSKLKIAVLFGGRSGEHEVSLASAQSVMSALDPDKYEIIPVGITREGAWIVGADPMRALEEEDFARTRPAAMFADPSERGLWASRRESEGAELSERSSDERRLSALSRVDVVFPVLHGTFGEDGTVQGLLELAGVPYVGAGVLCSALAMDKIAFKDVITAHNLPTPDYVWMTRRAWEAEPDAWLDRIEARLGFPVFTKPANLGSSVGISKCPDRESLRRGVDEAAQYDRRMLVEWAVPAAREIEVSVLGNEEPSASIPGEVVPSREFYDYAAKYLDTGENASGLLIPAPLDEGTTEAVQSLAIETYRAIDGAGMARVDFLVNGDNDDLYVNEVNTIPGFTSISMYPKLWDASGVPYGRLLDWLVDLALDRHQENSRSERIYRPTRREGSDRADVGS